MIRVRVKGNPDRIEGFTVWGHARFARRGTDVVCAGVSAVATTALIGLTSLVPGSARYRVLPQGLIYCRLKEDLPPDKAREAQAILKTMTLGLLAIREEYKGTMDFTYRR